MARIYPATDDGTETGNPVLLTTKQLDEKRKQGPYIFSCQQLMAPAGDKTQGFKREWLQQFTNQPPLAKTNNYILVDAASSKKRGSDYTAMWLVQLGVDGNYYCTPICRDRLNLTERTARLFKAHRDFKPKQVRYEKYGLMADIEHVQSVMETDHYRFRIEEVGGQTSKEDRIKRLIPLFEQGKIWIARSVHVTDWEGKVRDLIQDFIEEEYAAFPVGLHDDMLDSLSRIAEPDLKLVWPKEETPKLPPPVIHRTHNSETAWMA
jgi:predicted phage terminase large subunit-like protein